MGGGGGGVNDNGLHSSWHESYNTEVVQDESILSLILP